MDHIVLALPDIVISYTDKYGSYKITCSLHYFRSEQKYNSLSSSGSPIDHASASPADQGSESAKIRRENILAELLDTEARYVSDLREVLVHYR